jgi:hypothetical protein
VTKRDEVDAVLELGELAVADDLIDAQLAAFKKKSKGDPAALTPVLRRRAILAEEGSIDDDPPSLAQAAKRIGEAAAQPDATDDDRARWAWALLMANMTGKARKAGGDDDPMLTAGLAYARKPSDKTRAVLFAASKKHPERAVRLVLQRSLPVSTEARALFEARQKKAPLPDRHTLRALRLLVDALRVDGDAEAETLHRLDPEYGLSPEATLLLRQKRLQQVEALLGKNSPLLLMPYFRLRAAAKDAGALALSVELRLVVDDLLAKKRGGDALTERAALLTGVWRDLVQLGRIDEAAHVIETRDEPVRMLRQQDVPHHTARAEICEARGDWDGCIREHELAVKQARESKHPAYGPESNNTRLTEGWLKFAKERAAKARAKQNS